MANQDTVYHVGDQVLSPDPDLGEGVVTSAENVAEPDGIDEWITVRYASDTVEYDCARHQGVPQKI